MKIFVLLSALFIFASPSFAAPTPYTIQKNQSKVGFSWFLGKDEVKGSMPIADARIVLDLEQLQNSRVTVMVDVARAKAGFPFASQGMKSKTVLWAKKHRYITFEGKRFRRNGNTALVDGTLTVRGVTRPATFTAKLFRTSRTGSGDQGELAVRLNGSLSRAAFGADGFSDMAGDQVKLSIVALLRATR
ncbi:MAG: YceI family protein [Pseudomonadota bacterium]